MAKHAMKGGFHEFAEQIEKIKKAEVRAKKKA